MPDRDCFGSGGRLHQDPLGTIHRSPDSQEVFEDVEGWKMWGREQMR